MAVPKRLLCKKRNQLKNRIEEDKVKG